MKRAFPLVAFLLMAFSLPGLSLASPFTGLPVTDIRIQDEQGRQVKDNGKLAELLVTAPGEVFSGERIRQGITYLYLTGRFQDIRVDGFPEGTGVKLVYTVLPVTIVDEVVIRGNRAFSDGTIREAFRGVEGRELREDRFADYRTDILTQYQSEGYYGAGVDFRVERRQDQHRATLFVYIVEPKRTMIGGVDFTGNKFFTGKQLVREMENRPGRPLRTDILFDQDMAAIVEKYTAAGYPAAKPGPVNIRFQDERAYILIEGREGPRVTTAFSGNHAFSDSKLRELLLIRSEHDVSDAIIEGSADKIRSLYRAQGYESAAVAVKKAETPGALDLVFQVDEGRRVTVREITVAGNAYFRTKEIKAEMSLRESGWFSSNPFSQALLDRDLEYLRERYGNAGFLSADIKGKADLDEKGRASIAIDITEGPQTSAGAITFEGNQAYSDAELQERLSLKPGDPYNERLVEEDRYRILSAYSDKGYLYARVEAEQRTVNGTVEVHYRVSEDRQVSIGRIIIRGNESTREGVIRRELLLSPGDAYQYEKILKSQQRIYRLGYFNLARFEPVSTGEKDSVRDMVFSVEERPAGSFEIGVGYGDLDRARAFVEVSHRDLWGLAHYSGVRFEQSDILKRAIMNYQHPWFFGYDLNGKFALVWSDMKHINSDTREIYYQTRQTAASYGVEKKMDQVKTSLTYAFENVENYNLAQGAEPAPEDSGHVRVSSLSPALVWDRRDDIFDPRKGALYGVVLKQAMHQLGSQADFTKVSVRSSWYVPLAAGVVTALSARAGMAWPHYETDRVPIHERFTVGGSTTIRGYNQDMVGADGTFRPGPDDSPIPIGGESMVLFNAEVRLIPSRGFGFVLFTDAGNVWPDQQIDLDDLRASYGAGIRYGTPVGPLRIDYGQKIHRRPGESPGELHFNIGHTF